MKIEIDITNEIKEIPDELLDIILVGEKEEQTKENRNAIINAVIEGIIEDETMKELLLKEIQLRVDLCAADYDKEATEKIIAGE